MRPLFPWQETVYSRVRGQPRVALFLEMRLGKTSVAIRWALDHLDTIMREELRRGRVLVVGPNSVLDDWIDELQAFCIKRSHIYPLYNLEKYRRLEMVDAPYGWFLVNYEGVRVMPQLWADLAGMVRADHDGPPLWDVVIVDESTGIRSPKAKITKIMTTQFETVPYRAILTGNPNPEGIEDFFTQMQFLHGSVMGFRNYWVWRQEKFHQSTFARWSWTPNPGTREAMKDWVHERAVFLTRREANVGGIELPMQRRMIDMNDEQKKAYKEVRTKYSYEYIQTNFATTRDVWLARIAGGFSPDRENPQFLSKAKAQELSAVLQGELRSEPVVVWFRFNEELEHTVRHLREAGIATIGITGATPLEQRKEYRDRFNAGEFRAICIQVQLGKFGWNLSRARTVIYYSRPYEYEANEQSKQRVVHPSKTDPWVVIDLVTRGTIDEDIHLALREKHMNSRLFRQRIDAAARTRLMEVFSEGKSQGQNKGQGQGSAGPDSEVRARRIYPGDRRG